MCLTSAATRPRVTLAEIVRVGGDAVARTHRLAMVQQVALRAIAACRTARLGGHTETCDHCGVTRITYNSCRNRHCPTCQTSARARWLEARRAELLPIPYFHVVFTLPHALNALAQGNPRVVYGLLFRAATETLLAFGRDPRHLGGTIGVTAILHTWGQTLTQHLHLHCVVTGGALSREATRWIPARLGFLFPVRALSVVCRAKFLDGLRRAHDAHRLAFAGSTTPLTDPATWRRFLHTLHAQAWVVYAKPPFGGAARVLAYLARYTHRVAITNHRLVDLTDGRVRFQWKDYADHDRHKIMTLTAEEFLRRFLLHVLPAHFVRIRHAGLFGNRRRHARLDRCRALLGVPPDASLTAEPPPRATSSGVPSADRARCTSRPSSRPRSTRLARPAPRTHHDDHPSPAARPCRSTTQRGRPHQSLPARVVLAPALAVAHPPRLCRRRPLAHDRAPAWPDRAPPGYRNLHLLRPPALQSP